MINGLPGRVASETASAFLENQDRFELVPLSFTGPEIEQSKWEQGGASVRLVRPDERPEAEEELKKHQPFIVVDFTLPSAVMDNVAEYCRRGWPFVIGTTGADYEAIAEQVAKVDFCAVANPNMSIPIVLIQSALSYLAENFPGALDGWKAGIVESHQQGKADTSGTAKHMVRYFNALGVDIDVDQIEKIRDPERQKNEVQVPQEYLSGHAYHTYRLKSPDGSVELGFLHNVLGRRTYAVGTIQSVEFLQSQLDQGCKGKLFSMLDVLSAGKK
jgi:4-hydroxy-tetrahydrodipicolinate reductase